MTFLQAEWTPCVQTSPHPLYDLLQDIHEFPQDMQNTYDDLLSYPSTSDDMRALSRTLAAFRFSRRVRERARRSSDVDG